MDRKAKKKLDNLHSRLQILLQQLAGAKRQPDDPSEPKRLEAQIARVRQEIDQLKGRA